MHTESKSCDRKPECEKITMGNHLDQTISKVEKHACQSTIASSPVSSLQSQ